MSRIGPPRTAGEQTAIALAQENGRRYRLSAHVLAAMRLGLDDDAVLDARAGRASDAKTGAMLRLAVDINHERGHASDDALVAARDAGLSDEEIVEIVAHVAVNVFTNYLNNVARTPLDYPELDLDV